MLRPVPAAPDADTVHLHRAARPHAVGNPANEAARRLPAAADPAQSPRRRSGRAGVRAHSARGRGRRLATREAPNAPDCDPRHSPPCAPSQPGTVDEPAALAGVRPPSSDVVAATLPRTSQHAETPELAAELFGQNEAAAIASACSRRCNRSRLRSHHSDQTTKTHEQPDVGDGFSHLRFPILSTRVDAASAACRRARRSAAEPCRRARPCHGC